MNKFIVFSLLIIAVLLGAGKFTCHFCQEKKPCFPHTYIEKIIFVCDDCKNNLNN